MRPSPQKDFLKLALRSKANSLVTPVSGTSLSHENEQSLTAFAAARHPRPAFVTTRWSVVLRAARTDTTRARDALASLCRTYWYPLYAHARRRGCSPHDAQDLTQEFFLRLLDRRLLSAADPHRGRFRSFLLTALNHFIASEWAKARAGKRGGHVTMLSLDWAAAEQRYALEPADDSTPDKAFDKRWALELLETVLKRLEWEHQQAGKAAEFAALKQSLTGTRESQPYAILAAELGWSEGAVKVAVHRLRKRYRELIREEIAGTVATADEVNVEMRHLMQALAG